MLYTERGRMCRAVCRVQWSKYIQSTVGMFTDTWQPVKGRDGDNIIITLQWIWHTVLHVNVEKKKKKYILAL